MQMFDASKITPQQAGGKHPVGNKFPFTITHTEKKPVANSNDKFMFSVTFTSPAGSIVNNYNMWNPSAQAVDIAAKQLSALCHAVGQFQVDLETGMQLRGKSGLMDVDFQAGQGPTAEKPEGGYVEVKKIYDVNGNEPGKPAGSGAAPSGQSWGPPANAAQQAQQAQANQAQPQVQQNWQNGAAPNPAPNPPANNAGGGWTQGAGGTAEKPPWQS